MPNFKSVVYFLLVDFGGGRRRRSSCCYDRGKTKSTPCPFNLDWNKLGLEYDKNKFLSEESPKRFTDWYTLPTALCNIKPSN